MRNIIVYIAIYLPLLCFPQEKISLKEALELGLNQNYKILISKQDYKISQVQNNWANAGALPQININATAERNLSDQRNNPTSFIQAMLKSDGINASANLNWTLFNGFSIRANKKRLNELEDLSEGNLTLIIENTLQSIIMSYYTCILQQKRLDLLQEVVNTSKERLIYERTKNNIGISSNIDLLQIENSLLTDSSNLVTQALNFSNSMKNFNLLIGVEVNKEWNFDQEIQHEFQLYNYELLLEKTLSNNANIRNQYINIEIAEQDMKISKSRFYPIVTLNSGGYFNQNYYDLGDFEYEGSSSGKVVNYFTNLTISLRLFDGGKLHRTLKEIRILNEKKDIQLEEMKQNISNQLSQILDQYNSRIVIYNINKKAYEIAKKNYYLALDKKNRGSINSFMLRDIELSFISSGLSFLQSSYYLKESEISLIKITGGIIQHKNNN